MTTVAASELAWTLHSTIKETRYHHTSQVVLGAIHLMGGADDADVGRTTEYLVMAPGRAGHLRYF